MNIFLMGGWMMWPLALISIMATAIVVERLLLFSSCRFPQRGLTILLEEAVQGDIEPLLEAVRKVHMLRRFADLLSADGPGKEAALRIEGEAVVKRLEARLPMLSILAKLAPLMGLLGTVLGMISTFSEIANAQAGINMNQLAGGIWQALITTAAGLFIAIPALFFLHYFQTRVDEVASALSEAANAVLATEEEA
ncbi:MotA/TolQ/ExbB proton channel family protein [Mailhella massiliensis]|uniref:MotA/TolQ/ExbB proton channel family protein n=1 Tax=Mailhella massiliensis TaxID=1903261 RepID=A0A921DS09_9BACT|nr:MotA/TolQ/ExbB proton channel family protein [Mailhella massiliensis]HJD97686.1 MotA/TolQ/ExbB proton channel family protein [Mailhella massiliensis]